MPDRLPPGPAPAHVVHIIGQLMRGGTELQLARLVQMLDRDRWRCTVVSFWGGGDPRVEAMLAEANCPIVYLHKKRGFRPGFALVLARALRQLRPDLVHTWLNSAAMWGRVVQRLARLPSAMVCSYRGQSVHHVPGARTLDRFLAARTDYCICNARRLQAQWLERLGWSADRIRVIPNGIDPSRFCPSADGPGLRRRLGLPDEAFVVTMVGSMYPVKNWPMFLETARRVTAQRPAVLFLGVGGGHLLEEMRARAASLGLGPDHVQLLGERADVPELLAASNVGMLTSNSEGMPNAVLEAMACGLPVVSTRVSGAEELVEARDGGYLVALNDAEAAERHILHLHDHPENCRTMGQANRRLAETEFSFARMAEAHAEVYGLALARRSEPRR